MKINSLGKPDGWIGRRKSSNLQLDEWTVIHIYNWWGCLLYWDLPTCDAITSFWTKDGDVQAQRFSEVVFRRLPKRYFKQSQVFLSPKTRKTQKQCVVWDWFVQHSQFCEHIRTSITLARKSWSICQCICHEICCEEICKETSSSNKSSWCFIVGFFA